MEFWNSLMQGGPLVPIIGIASILGLTVFFERLWATRQRRVFPIEFARSVMELAKEGRVAPALTMANEHQGPLAAILRALFQAGPDKSRAELKERMEEVGSLEISYLGRYISLLSSISTVAPLLGLLGTVLGMVEVFQAVELSTEPQISDLAGGIWEALLTTVAGLSVAIPAFLGHRFLQSRVERLALKMEEYSMDLLEALLNKGKDNLGEA